MTDFEPRTVTTGEGVTVVLSREGNLVTARVSYADASLVSSGIPFPFPETYFSPSVGVIVESDSRVAFYASTDSSFIGFTGIMVTKLSGDATGSGSFELNWLSDPVDSGPGVPTGLAYAVRNLLVQHPSVTSLLGVDDLDDPMIYPNRPEATVENTGKCLVVVRVDGGWGANDHNTARFPVLAVDIWADPTRNADNSVRMQDASLKAEAVFKAIDKLLHLVHASMPGGGAVYWGTPSQIANKTGVRITSSVRNNEPDERPAFNDEGAVIWQVRYNVSI